MPHRRLTPRACFSTFASLQQDTIPTYFDKPIIFASFLRKLQRWGFNQVSRKQDGRYEFCSPTFKRLDAESPSADAAAFDSILNIDFANYSW
jgi:hypothetical protein